MPRFTDEHIPTVVARLSHALDEEWRTTLRKLWAPVNLMEWRILAALADGEPETLTRVAERSCMQQPTASKVLDRVEERGLMTRSQDQRDRRITRAFLTKTGHEAANALMMAALEHETQVLGRMPTLAGRSLPDALAALERGDD